MSSQPKANSTGRLSNTQPNSFRTTTVKCLIHSLLKSSTDHAFKELETLLIEYAKSLVSGADYHQFMGTIELMRPLLKELTVTKLDKFVKNMVDAICISNGNQNKRANVLQAIIITIFDINRQYLGFTILLTYLKHCNKFKMSTNVIRSTKKIIHHLKVLSINDVLVEIYLEESIAFYNLKNYMKSKAALMNGKSLVSGGNLEVEVQSRLDMHSGALFLVEKEYGIAYSYFYEALENFDNMKKTNEAIDAFKYMCITKLIMNRPEEVKNLFASKFGLKYFGPQIKVLQDMAIAIQKKSLSQFDKVIKANPSLKKDIIIKNILKSLYDLMLDQDISRALKPYTVTDLNCIAKKVGISQERLHLRLCFLILDDKLNAVIFDNEGIIVLNEESPSDANVKVLELGQKLIQKSDMMVIISQVHASLLHKSTNESVKIPRAWKKNYKTFQKTSKML